jgi:death-on-curing protein
VKPLLPKRPPVFLTVDEVLALHEHQIAVYGGSPGLRDFGLLESAAATPSASFGGELLHASLPEMAAAYLYHLTSNHAFVDGNKRVGLAAALTFLRLNGLRETCSGDALVELTLGVADGSLSKAEVAVFFAKHTASTKKR